MILPAYLALGVLFMVGMVVLVLVEEPPTSSEHGSNWVPILGTLASASFVLRLTIKLFRYVFTIEPNGFGEVPRHSPDRRIPWNRVKAIRVRTYAQRLQLLDASAEVLGALEFEVEDCEDALARIVDRVPPPVPELPATFVRKSLNVVILVSLASVAVVAVATSCSDLDTTVGVAIVVAVTGAAILVERETMLRTVTVREDGMLVQTGRKYRLIPWAAVTDTRFAVVHSRSNTWIDVEITLVDGRKERVCPFGADVLGLHAAVRSRIETARGLKV